MNNLQEKNILLSLYDFSKMVLLENNEEVNIGSPSERFSQLPIELQDAIKSEILSLTTDDLSEAHRVLKKYFRLNVPDSVVIKALLNDIDVAYEVALGGVGDTYARDVLIDSIIVVIGMNEPSENVNEAPLSYWPFLGSSEDYNARFLEKLKEKMRLHGITSVEDEV